MNYKTASEFDVFSKGDIYKNKLLFEQAAAQDILECRAASNLTSVVKSEMIALREEHQTKTQMPIDDQIRYFQLKQSLTEAITGNQNLNQ